MSAAHASTTTMAATLRFRRGRKSCSCQNECGAHRDDFHHDSNSTASLSVFLTPNEVVLMMSQGLVEFYELIGVGTALDLFIDVLLPNVMRGARFEV